MIQPSAWLNVFLPHGTNKQAEYVAQIG